MGILDELFSAAETIPNDGWPSGDELEQIIMRPEAGKEARDMARQIRRMEGDVRAAGLEPESAEPRSSLFGELLDTLDAPRQGVAGVIDTVLRGDMFEPGVGFGWSRGQAENTTASDIFRRHDIIDNPILRGTIGFAADVLTDPLTYLTFGTGTAVNVGGKALTKGGAALRNIATERLLKNGLADPIHISEILDEAFKGVARYQDAAKNFSNATSDTVKALEATRMARAEDVFSSVIKPEEIIGQELFEKAKLRIGATLPFLGHVTGGETNVAKELVLKDPGPVGQAFRLMGEVWKPGKVKLAELELSPGLVEAASKASMYANEKLGQLGQAIASVPLVGPAATKAKDTLSAANNLFKKIFNQKALTGANANNNRLDYLSFKAGAKLASKDRAFEALGTDIITNPALQKEIFLAIDGQAMGALKDSIQEAPDALEAINRIRSGVDATEADQLLFRDLAQKTGAEENFRFRIDNLMLDPNVAPEVKDGVQRVMRTMDELALDEAAAGMGYSRLEYYIPHRYKNIDGAARKATSGKPTSFTKARKYSSIVEAWEEGGKVADVDLAGLLQSRIEKFLLLQAQRKYAQRLMIEEGLDEGLVTSMYKEALLDPKGQAAQALKRYRIELRPLNLDELQDAAVTAERAKVYAGVGLKNPESSKRIAESAAEFQQKVHEELWANGRKPLDNWLPQEALGEIGERVTMPGGGESFFLPKPIADSFKETIAARDVLKDAIGESAFGKATLKLLDHGTSFFKKLVTLPFPAYWAQNFIGDRFNQMMAGPAAMNPGIFARTHSLMKGNSVIKSPSGVVLNKEALDRVIKEFGMPYSANDFLGTIDSFGDMNVDKFLAMKDKGIVANLAKAGNKANRQAALSQIHDKMQKSFDGFFRVSQFVHRFEQGDSIADAVRNANDLYFNYRDMSPVEASLFRRFYMFYGYMSKATKQTLNSLITRPGNLTMQLAGVRGLAETFSDPNAAPTAEEWDSKLLGSTVTNEQISRMVGRTPEGKAIMGRGFAAPLNAVMQQFTAYAPRNLSVGELIDTVADSTTRTIQKQFATANPAINAAAQIVSGKNLYFDKPLSAEFLRKLPSLNAAAEKLTGLKYNELPLDLDAPAKLFLKAVPDGKGRLIADQGRMWVLMNLVPGLSRATSTAGTFTNQDIPLAQSLLRAGLGVNLQDSDPSRSYLYERRRGLQEFMNDNSVRQRLKNQREEELQEE